MPAIQAYTNYFIKIWENSPNKFPSFQRGFTSEEKREREHNFENFEKRIKKLQSRKTVLNLQNNQEQFFFPMFKRFLESVFDFEQHQLEVILSDDFKNVSKDFFYKARAFGPELKPGNIFQALRNVWIMNGIQLVTNLPVRITPSVFAYSMIYPYSDNFLDDPKISGIEKQEFSVRFNARLHGENVKAKNFTEEQLFSLVAFFEDEFPRNEYAEVYRSLYAIQKAQTNSLSLLKQNGLSDSSTKTICFEKGGASVLADGFLVAGKLTNEQERALFGYGVYLQLLDDIQDLKEDSLADTKTIFSCTEKRNLGNYVNQTINFGRTVLEEMKCFPGAEDGAFLELMNRSIETMIIKSVGLNNNWYTDEYIDLLEKYSPLHFEFLRQKKTESKSKHFSIFQRYFSQAAPEKVHFDSH